MLDFTLIVIALIVCGGDSDSVKQKARKHGSKLRVVARAYSPRNLEPEGGCGLDASLGYISGF